MLQSFAVIIHFNSQILIDLASESSFKPDFMFIFFYVFIMFSSVFEYYRPVPVNIIGVFSLYLSHFICPCEK